MPSAAPPVPLRPEHVGHLVVATVDDKSRALLDADVAGRPCSTALAWQIFDRYFQKIIASFSMQV